MTAVPSVGVPPLDRSEVQPAPSGGPTPRYVARESRIRDVGWVLLDQHLQLVRFTGHDGERMQRLAEDLNRVRELIGDEGDRGD